MKQLILFFIQSLWVMMSLGQASLHRENAPLSSTNDNWQVSNYVWSHTHPISSKGSKPVLNFDAIDNWEGIGSGSGVAISANGKYFSCRVGKKVTNNRDRMIVQSTSNSWRMEVSGGNSGFFSGDNVQYIYQYKNDLCFLKLGENQPLIQSGISSFKKPDNDKNEWLAWHLKNATNTVVLKNLFMGKEERIDSVLTYDFDKNGNWLIYRLTIEPNDLLIYSLSTSERKQFQSVSDYYFDENGKVLLLKTITKIANDTLIQLQYVDLLDGNSKIIWSSSKNNSDASSILLDEQGKRIIFMVRKGERETDNSIWYYERGMPKAAMIADNRNAGLRPELLISGFDNTLGFSSGSYVKIVLQQSVETLHTDSETVAVDVWSYKDTILQSSQCYMLKSPKLYWALLNVKNGRIIWLENEFEKIKQIAGGFAIIARVGREKNGDRFWENGYNVDSNWLLSLNDGSRKLLKTRWDRAPGVFWFSPSNRYLIYFDAEQSCNYFSYDLQNHQLVNISAGIPGWLLGSEKYYQRPHEKPTYLAGVAGWLPGSNGFIVYDDYDIWLLDPTGKKPPENITNGYGRLHNIILRIEGELGKAVVLTDSTNWILLKAFNRKNKYNGYYKKVIGQKGDPELLFMGPCLITGNISGTAKGMEPLKASNANTWIVKRQTYKEAPNYFVTTDFKVYKPLTDVQPQKQYNWLTAELHSFTQLDGTISQGILYKPENFDSSKRYPVIVSFYATVTDLIYHYKSPQYLESPILVDNPGWFVSHGYLVFVPDVYFSKGNWGPSIVNTVVGAAKYLSKLPFVDGNKMGACGHSNSGRFGHYLLTHSHSFAAISAGAGATNILTTGLSLDAIEGISMLEWAEVNSLGTGLGNIWENKETWLDHTSVLHADKVTSAFLLFHNKKDHGGRSVAEAAQMFIALRRLEKKVWWLQYDDGGHILSELRDCKDYTIRYTQFFDHYLKAAPPPKWMTEGIPARLKKIEMRYELDTIGSCNRACSICKSRNYLKIP